MFGKRFGTSRTYRDCNKWYLEDATGMTQARKKSKSVRARAGRESVRFQEVEACPQRGIADLIWLWKNQLSELTTETEGEETIARCLWKEDVRTVLREKGDGNKEDLTKKEAQGEKFKELGIQLRWRGFTKRRERFYRTKTGVA